MHRTIRFSGACTLKRSLSAIKSARFYHRARSKRHDVTIKETVFFRVTDRGTIRPGNCAVLTVHLPFVGKDDFASTAWRIYGKSFLEALFDIRRPHTLRIRRRQVLLVLENTIVMIAARAEEGRTRIMARHSQSRALNPQQGTAY